MRTVNLWLVFAFALTFTDNLVAVQFAAGDVDTLIMQLDHENARQREDAAESLSQTVDADKISPAIRKRLKTETNFHVKLALHYALASQGEKESLLFLIDSLSQSGHMGANYLRFTVGEDFGWNADKYRDWYERTSAEEFLKFINDRWRRKPMMDEYAEFSSLYSKQFFGSMKSDDEDSIIPDVRLTDADKKKLESLPTAKAWSIFQTGLTELQKNGDRKEAARQFRIVATEYANTYYADESRELADLLDKMIAEDSDFKKPLKVDDLELKSKIKFHIHNLRDVVAYQFSQPGYCHVLNGFSISGDETYNAAVALRDIGEPAIPYLIEILEDRRPIRGVGYWRNFRPNRTVLRYQDAAIQIIDAIRSENAYDRRTTSSYFSTERPEKRTEIIEALKPEK